VPDAPASPPAALPAAAPEAMAREIDRTAGP